MAKPQSSLNEEQIRELTDIIGRWAEMHPQPTTKLLSFALQMPSTGPLSPRDIFAAMQAKVAGDPNDAATNIIRMLEFGVDEIGYDGIRTQLERSANIAEEAHRVGQ